MDIIVDIHDEEYNVYNAVCRALDARNLAIDFSAGDAYYVAGVIVMNLGCLSFHFAYNQSVSELMAYFRNTKRTSAVMSDISQIVEDVMDSPEFNEVVAVLAKLNEKDPTVLPALRITRVDFKSGVLKARFLDEDLRGR